MSHVDLKKVLYSVTEEAGDVLAKGGQKGDSLRSDHSLHSHAACAILDPFLPAAKPAGLCFTKVIVGHLVTCST